MQVSFKGEQIGVFVCVPGHFLILSLPAPSTLTLLIARTGLLLLVNPVSVGDGSLAQFEEKYKLANLTSDLPTPVASTSAPLSTCSASVAVVVNSTSNDMLNSFAFDSFVLPQDNIELASRKWCGMRCELGRACTQ